MEGFRQQLHPSFSVSFTFSFVQIYSEIYQLIRESCIVVGVSRIVFSLQNGGNWIAVYKTPQFSRIFRHSNLAGLNKISVFPSKFQHFYITNQMPACSVLSQSCTSLPVAKTKNKHKHCIICVLKRIGAAEHTSALSLIRERSG